jgi:hypothetical protein
MSMNQSEGLSRSKPSDSCQPKTNVTKLSRIWTTSDPQTVDQAVTSALRSSFQLHINDLSLSIDFNKAAWVSIGYQALPSTCAHPTLADDALSSW